MEINITKINLNPNAGGGNSGGGGSSNTTSFQHYNAAAQQYLAHKTEWYWEDVNGQYETTYGIDTSMVLVDSGWKNYYYDGNEFQYIYDAYGTEYATPFVSSDIMGKLHGDGVVFMAYEKLLDNNCIIMGQPDYRQYFLPNGDWVCDIKAIYDFDGNTIQCYQKKTDYYEDYYIENPITNESFSQFMLPVKQKGYVKLNKYSNTTINNIDWDLYRGCVVNCGGIFEREGDKLYILTPMVTINSKDFCLYYDKLVEEYEWDFSKSMERYAKKIPYRGIKYLKPIVLADATTLSDFFRDCKQLMVINGFKDEQPCKINYMSHLCYGCECLVEFNGNGIDTSECYDMQALFGNCNSLKTMDISDWDFSSANNVPELIPNNLEELKFGKNLKSKLTTYNGYLPTEGVMEIINGLFDFVSAGVQPTSSQGILKIPNLLRKLSNEQIAIGTAKGWTITA